MKKVPSKPAAKVPQHDKRPHEVRIIGGQWKRTRLAVADKPGLRPTPDRVRETLFNWLASLAGAGGGMLPGWHCFDAFAGTGQHAAHLVNAGVGAGGQAVHHGLGGIGCLVDGFVHVVGAFRQIGAFVIAGAIQILAHAVTGAFAAYIACIAVVLFLIVHGLFL